MLGTFSPILVSERYYYYYICVNIICNQLLYCSYMSLQIEVEEALKNRCVCDTRAEKFNIVSNNHGRTRKCDFSVSNCKYRFWANLVQNIKKVSLSWNLVPRLIRICRVHWLCSLFPFMTKNIQKYPFWTNLAQNSKLSVSDDYGFELRFGTYNHLQKILENLHKLRKSCNHKRNINIMYNEKLHCNWLRQCLALRFKS